MSAATAVAARSTLVVPAAELKAAASWAARIVPLRPPVPILGGIVIGRDEAGHLTLSAFDYETYGSIVVDGADTTFDEPVLVHGRLLSDAAARMGGMVTLTLDEHLLTLTSGSTRVAIRRMPVDNYPSTPPAAPPLGAVDGEDLVALVRRAAVCCGTDATKDPGLQALRLKAEGGQLLAHATDKYRASRTQCPWVGQDFEALVRGEALEGALRGMNGTVQVGADDVRVTLAAPDRSATISRSGIAWGVDGIERLWSARGGSVQIERQRLLDAIATARLSLGADTKGLHLFVGEDQVIVAAASDRSDSTTGIDAAVTDLAGTEIVLNPGFLSDLLGGVPDERVLLSVDANRPARRPLAVQGVGGDGQTDPAVSYLLVPIVPVASR